MSYYLEMDGATNYLRTPSLTFTDIYIDTEIEQREGVQSWYVDARTGIGFAYFNRTPTGTDTISVFNAVYIDGVAKTSGTAFVPHLTRCLIRVVKTTGGTDDVNIFSANNGGSPTKGKLYDIKFYNGASLVAHYDLTLGNAQDQSGNGNHATLNGGTFVDDGSGPTVIETSAVISGVSTVAASVNKRLTSSVVISGVSTVAAGVRKVITIAADIAGISTVTASTGRQASAAIVGQSTVTATIVKRFSPSSSIAGAATVTATAVKKILASVVIASAVQISTTGSKRMNITAAIEGIGTMEINQNTPILADETIIGGRRLRMEVEGGRLLHVRVTGGV
jgi:hypothetical protein